MSNTGGAVAAMLAGYRSMIKRFIDGESSADEFETEFLSYFKSDTKQTVSNEFDVLDGLFADVDDYVSDPGLRASVGGLDEHQLRQRATTAYHRLYDVP